MSYKDRFQLVGNKKALKHSKDEWGEGSTDYLSMNISEEDYRAGQSELIPLMAELCEVLDSINSKLNRECVGHSGPNRIGLNLVSEEKIKVLIKISETALAKVEEYLDEE